MNQRLVLYPGVGKTGTTALQVFLRCSGEELAALGYSYIGDPLQGDRTTIGGGNGYSIFQALSAEGLSDDELEALVAAQMPEAGDAIIASEYLTNLTREQWMRFASLPSVSARDVSVVLMYRDLYPSAWSAYNQMIKRGGYAGECSTWVEQTFTAGLDFFHCVEGLRTCFGADTLTVLHYDSSRPALVEKLLSAGGIATGGLSLSRGGISGRIYNRSLNSAERAVMKAVNATYGDRYSAPLSDLLLRHDPRDQPELLLDRATLDYLDRNFAEQFSTANELYFGGQSTLQVCSPEILERFASGAYDADEPPSPASCKAALRVLLRKERAELPDDEIYGFLKRLRSELRATKRIAAR